MDERLIGHGGVASEIVVVGDPAYLVAGGSEKDPESQAVVAEIFDETNLRHSTVARPAASNAGARPTKLLAWVLVTAAALVPKRRPLCTAPRPSRPRSVRVRGDALGV